MRFLVGNNMFKEVEEGQVVPTELANCFMTGSSLREAVIHMSVPFLLYRIIVVTPAL